MKISNIEKYYQSINNSMPNKLVVYFWKSYIEFCSEQYYTYTIKNQIQDDLNG